MAVARPESAVDICCPDARPLRWLGGLYLLLLAFPYVEWIPFPSYTQPVPLVLASVLWLPSLYLLRRTPILDVLGLIGVAIIGCSLFLVLGAGMAEAQPQKYVLSYLSPLWLGIPALLVIRFYPETSLVVLRWSIALWFFVSLVQMSISPTFATFLLGQWGEYALDIAASGRGAIGLAPEPTHHGFHMLVLCAVMVLLDPTTRGRWWAALGVFDAVVLAGSSSTLMVLVLGGMTCLILRYPVRAVCLGLAAWLFWCWLPISLSMHAGAEGRVYLLLADLLKDPASVMADRSVNLRLGGLVATLQDIWINGLEPRGMGVERWDEARLDMLERNSWLYDLSEVGAPSGIGMMLFQGGFLVLPFLLLLFRPIVQVRGRSGVAQAIVLAMPFVFLSQYYLSAPAFAWLCGAALYRRYLSSGSSDMEKIECGC